MVGPSVLLLSVSDSLSTLSSDGAVLALSGALSGALCVSHMGFTPGNLVLFFSLLALVGGLLACRNSLFLSSAAHRLRSSCLIN